MRSALVIFGLLACAFVEFHFYPKHSFLNSDSQVMVALLERLQYPGLLSRDLAATHPVLRYTAYDEITLALARIGQAGLEISLASQLFVARLAALSGVFLLAFRCGAGRIVSLCIAALLGLGTVLPGIAVSTSNPEPVPSTLALGWILLAAGLATGEHAMPAALAAGVGLLYSPAIAAPFWFCFIANATLQKRLRPSLRPLITTFAVAILLLANLVQLQPGAPGGASLFAPINDSWLKLVADRVPAAIVSSWIAREGWLFAAFTSAGLCALYRLRRRLHPRALGLLAAIMLAGFVSLPATYAAQRWLRWTALLQMEPARALLLSASVCMVLLLVASSIALRKHHWREATVWLLALAGLLAAQFKTPMPNHQAAFTPASMQSLADWAQHSTWGGSMFLFAQFGKQTDAGRFRAQALRPVYVDWQSGDLSRFYEDFAQEWRRRWDAVNSHPTAAAQIAALLPEPIDYYVTARRDQVTGVSPVYANEELLVYDARDLRSAKSRLKHSN